MTWGKLQYTLLHLNPEESMVSSMQAEMLIDIVKSSLLILVGSKLFEHEEVKYELVYNMQVTFEESVTELIQHFPAVRDDLQAMIEFSRMHLWEIEKVH